MFINNLNWAKCTMETWIKDGRCDNLNSVYYEIIEKLNKDERKVFKAYFSESLVMHQMLRDTLVNYVDPDGNINKRVEGFYEESRICAALSAIIELLEV